MAKLPFFTGGVRYSQGVIACRGTGGKWVLETSAPAGATAGSGVAIYALRLDPDRRRTGPTESLKSVKDKNWTADPMAFAFNVQ